MKVKTSKRLGSIMELARRQAIQSCLPMKHGAVLFKGGSVLNVSHNRNQFNAFGMRFNGGNTLKATLHAELSCVLNLDKSITQGASIMVVRIRSNGDYALSKPCEMCHGSLLFTGVKKVYYSNNEGELEVMRL